MTADPAEKWKARARARDALRYYVRKEYWSEFDEILAAALAGAAAEEREDNERLLAALIALRDAVKFSPHFQDREYVQLGIQVNAAIRARKQKP